MQDLSLAIGIEELLKSASSLTLSLPQYSRDTIALRLVICTHLLRKLLVDMVLISLGTASIFLYVV